MATSPKKPLSPYLGLRLAEAEPLLAAAGVSYTVVRTEPDWKKDPVTGPLRIIRVRELAAAGGSCGTPALELVCCPVPDPFAAETE
jgi:hypothetical protein